MYAIAHGLTHDFHSERVLMPIWHFSCCALKIIIVCLCIIMWCV